MSLPFFICFALLALGGGLAVIINRSPVASALSLVVSFIGLAGLFIGLNAYFIGIIQILVYAGAIMVLFLFIIMLLDIQSEASQRFDKKMLLGAVVLAGVLSVQIAGVLLSFERGDAAIPEIGLEAAAYQRGEDAAVPSIREDLLGSEHERGPRLPDVKLVGETLFSKYGFHLQMLGVLLLVATIGVVTLSKRQID